MRWGRLLLVPHVVRLAVQAPRDASTRWDRYWAGVTTTGDGGDVLWDSSTSGEPQCYRDLLTAHADPALPVVDVGCGNGRFTRALAGHFPLAIGLDLATAAVERARLESALDAGLEFRTVDLTAPGTGSELAAELGHCNVFVRGVLHVLDPADRRRLAAGITDLAGVRGTVLIAETNYPGPLLGYLESLGAGPRGLPRPLARAISAGLPRPSTFGHAELDDTFPTTSWDRVLVDHDARIATVPMQRVRGADSVPGLVAVLRRRSPGPAG